MNDTKQGIEKLLAENIDLQMWKQEAINLLIPLRLYVEQHPDAHIGMSMINFVLHRAKCYDEVKVIKETNEQKNEKFNEALDYIKQLSDILEDNHARNDHETTSNAVMNAMNFYIGYRTPPAQATNQTTTSHLDNLPF